MGQSSLNELERGLMSLPARKGGLGIPNPIETASDIFETSRKSSEIITKAILGEVEFSHEEHKSQVRQQLNASRVERNIKQNEIFDSIVNRSTPVQRNALKETLNQRIQPGLQ